MCTQKRPYDYSQQLYDRYKEAFEEYIKSSVSEFYFCAYVNMSLQAIFNVVIFLASPHSRPIDNPQPLINYDNLVN
jgi:hypothetical protein